ncbi:hypothetical protein [Actinoplanes sp. NPDC051851]|uniref:hypothetical protein n=1 Tax=Actinoplanes sp. NPDC051851 TaxID=3154753 RepID=UPI00343A24D5
MRIRRAALPILLLPLFTAACRSDPAFVAASPAPSPVSPSPSSVSSSPSLPSSFSLSPSPSPVTTTYLPKPGNPGGKAVVPAAARAVDTSRPSRTVGDGTPSSCTSAAVVRAVAAGGVITFDCGPAPVTITMKATAKAGTSVVLDGGNRVTLSGAGKRRILAMESTGDTPRLTIQNMAFTRGFSSSSDGGGAVFARGGRLKVVNSRFTGNGCARTGPDLGGGAIRVLDQPDRPVYVVGSTFTGGTCSNGAALSSIGVSWTILNSRFTDNEAVGHGANPAKSGTPGGGSGGAIYLDGNAFTLTLDGTLIEDNTAAEGGGAVFFVSNDRTGTLKIRNSELRHNESQGFETPGYPGIFYLGAGTPQISGSRLAD